MATGLPTKHYVDANGAYIGGFAGVRPDPIWVAGENGEPELQQPADQWPSIPAGAIEVPYPPEFACDIWNGNGYTPGNRPVVDPSPLDTVQMMAVIQKVQADPALAAAFKTALGIQ